jgi:hypothetical protein
MFNKREVVHVFYADSHTHDPTPKIEKRHKINH